MFNIFRHNLFTQCRYSTYLRALIAYSNLLTLAAIAVTRTVGCLRFLLKAPARTKALSSPATAAIGCLLIWVVTGVLCSPCAFNITIGGYNCISSRPPGQAAYKFRQAQPLLLNALMNFDNPICHK